MYYANIILIGHTEHEVFVNSQYYLQNVYVNLKQSWSLKFINPRMEHTHHRNRGKKIKENI